MDSNYLTKALVATLYNMGKVTGKEACQILGFDRRTFEDMLPQFGFSVLSDDGENIQIELRA